MASSLIAVSFFVVASRAHIATTENCPCFESLNVVASQDQPQYTIVLIIGTLK